MKKFWLPLILLVVVVIGSIGYVHATKNKRRHSEGASAPAMYEMYCARCHGVNGVPVSNNFDLRVSALSLDSFVEVLKNGRNAMPAFKKTFLDSEFEPLYRHTQTLKH
jgi:mono/diheme cytochrome c family protein